MKKLQFRFLSHRSARIVTLLSVLVGLLLAALALSIAEQPWAVWVLLGGAALLSAILYLGHRWVYLPYRETEKMLNLFVDGYSMQSFHELRHPYSPAMESALEKLNGMMDTSELINASKKQAQYLALQNQINPHFLYNTLEGIRGEAITAGLDNVAKMTEALSTFFRYTISNVEQLVTLEDELHNIDNYYIIQRYRFGERINLFVDCDEEDREELYQYRMPKLTLQPIVENAIIHGIERKIDRGNIRIKLEATSKRLIITVSDDGAGMDETRLRELNRELETPSLDFVKPDREKRGGIAIINVNSRIRLLFGEEYGISIYSTVDVGTDVEITLPLLTGNAKGY